MRLGATYVTKLNSEPEPHLWIVLTDFDEHGKAIIVNVTTTPQIWGGGADLEIAGGMTLTEAHHNPYVTKHTSYLVPQWWKYAARDYIEKCCLPHCYRGQIKADWHGAFLALVCKYVEEVEDAGLQAKIDAMIEDASS